jgi:hypothetical protein
VYEALRNRKEVIDVICESYASRQPALKQS